jgi:hypothetical protein
MCSTSFEDRFQMRHTFLPGDQVEIHPLHPGLGKFYSRVVHVQEHSVRIGSFFRPSPDGRCAFDEPFEPEDCMVPPDLFIWSGLTNDQLSYFWVLVHYM